MKSVARWILAPFRPKGKGGATHGSPALAGETPVLPFAPKGLRKPLFFLHIPKTSGTSTNVLLKTIYGADNFVEHAEYQLPGLLKRIQPTVQVDCVSAHIPLCLWDLYRGTDAYARATVLRDPWKRLVSHVNWINTFNTGVPLPSGKTADAVARVAAALKETDFADRRSLERLFSAVSAEESFTAFDNMQVRMLLNKSNIAVYKTLEPTDAGAAIANLQEFDFYGFCEDRAGFEAGLMAAIGAGPVAGPLVHANSGSEQALRADNDIAYEVFAPWHALDHELYTAAVAAKRAAI